MHKTDPNICHFPLVTFQGSCSPRHGREQVCVRVGNIVYLRQIGIGSLSKQINTVIN